MRDGERYRTIDLPLYRERIAAALTRRGLEVETIPVCCVRSEVAAAVSAFEAKHVDALVTLHLAYSPLTGSSRSAGRIVSAFTACRDLCNLLIRHGKAFHIEAGCIYCQTA